MFTIPGRAADVCGVNVILSSFFSYAVYDVNRGAVDGCCAGGGGACACTNGCACVWGIENNDADADGTGAAVGDAGFGEASKSPRISCMLLFCGCGDMEDAG